MPHCVHCCPGATTPMERAGAAGRLAALAPSRPFGRPLRFVPLPAQGACVADQGTLLLLRLKNTLRKADMQLD